MSAAPALGRQVSSLCNGSLHRLHERHHTTTRMCALCAWLRVSTSLYV
jgi:hypothetical protein